MSPANAAFDGPSLAGIVFHLKSNNPDNPNAPNHTLEVTSQTPISTNFAFVEGTWRGDGPNAKRFTGSLTDGAVSITCSWANGMSGTNTLMARIAPASRIVANRWELTGNVVVADGTGNVVPGGPGMVSGGGQAQVLAQP
jgi:hypothetical protein